MKKRIKAVLDVLFIISMNLLPIFFIVKIINCAMGHSQIDWLDAIFILGYTFFIRE